MHIPYNSKLGRLPDFRVSYRFYSLEEGGRETLPCQGIRSDFWYDHEGQRENVLFMIWPEFEDQHQEIILDNESPVPKEGTARMWIINDDFRTYHRKRIVVGTKGWFREGSKATAECEVIEILSLKNAL